MNLRFVFVRCGASLACAVLAAVLWAGCDSQNRPASPSGAPALSEKQIKAWIEAADKGDALDKYSLGKKFRDGEGVPRDYTNAVMWFRKSADEGYAKAQYQLAMLHREGKGTPKDDVEAAKWLAKASEQGYGNAMEELGFMCWKGEGVPTNHVEAHKWLALAATEGEGKAAKGVKKLELSMSQQQIADAKKLEAGFVPKKVFKKSDKRESP